jgi:hypothetical protein
MITQHTVYYQTLFEGDKCTPARTVGDHQNVTQANVALSDLSETQINALIQKASHTGTTGGGASGTGKDISEVKYFNCHKKCHYANKCQDKMQTKELNWKKKAPGGGEPQIKTVKQEGVYTIYYWCAKCKRSTTSHNTLKHGNQADDPTPTPASTPVPPVAANMASMGEGLVHIHNDDSDV